MRLKILIRFKLIKNIYLIANDNTKLQINYFIHKNIDIFEEIGFHLDICNLKTKEEVVSEATKVRRVQLLIEDKLKLK